MLKEHPDGVLLGDRARRGETEDVQVRPGKVDRQVPVTVRIALHVVGVMRWLQPASVRADELKCDRGGGPQHSSDRRAYLEPFSAE